MSRNQVRKRLIKPPACTAYSWEIFLDPSLPLCLVYTRCLEQFNREALEMANDKLNGSVETLAYAFRDVMIEL